MANVFVITAALTGAVLTRADAPHLPVTPEEIVADAVACVDEGASVLHLHARGPDGLPSHDPAAYERLVLGIRAARPEAVICVSTTGRTGVAGVRASLAQRLAVLELSGAARPDMASLTLGSFNFKTEVNANDPQTILALARAMRARGIRPELELFDTGMAQTLRHLLDAGELDGPPVCNLILGAANACPAGLPELCHLAGQLPEGAVWAAGGVGRAQLPMNAAALLMGGNVRLGLEDCPWLDAGRSVPAGNTQLVRRVRELAERLGLRPASCAEARRILGVL